MNIGVLDDNPVMLDYIETTLNMDGHTVSKHTTGSSLLATLFSPTAMDGRLPYDLVILDLLLPGTRSGADVFIRIRQTFEADELPLVVITAVSGPTLEQFRQILPDDVPLLRKPFSPRSLRQLVTQQLRERRGVDL